MILGVGVDMVEVSRMRRILKRREGRFAQRILTDEELALHGKAHHPAASLAKQFAAKEAIAKALGTGMRGIGFKDIQVLRESSGKPVAELRGRARAVAERLGMGTIHVSISDEREYAVAFAVVES